MGRSERRTDWLGNEFIVHLDDHGEVVGTSEEREDWLGNPYTDHFDSGGERSGRSEPRTDLLGNTYREHYDLEGNVAGRSEDRTDWLGEGYIQHSAAGGEVTATSEGRENWLGNRYVQHYGDPPYYPASDGTRARSSDGQVDSNYPYSDLDIPYIDGSTARRERSRASGDYSGSRHRLLGKLLIGLTFFSGVVFSIELMTRGVERPQPTPAQTRTTSRSEVPVQPGMTATRVVDTTTGSLTEAVLTDVSLRTKGKFVPAENESFFRNVEFLRLKDSMAGCHIYLGNSALSSLEYRRRDPECTRFFGVLKSTWCDWHEQYGRGPLPECRS